MMVRALFIALLTLVCVAAGRAAALADCDATVTRSSIFFVTDREPLSDDPYFSGERGKNAARRPIISYGVVTPPVDVATLHMCSSKAVFLSAVGKRFTGVLSRSVMVYVHGYYRSFKQGAETAALMQQNLKFRGPVILYSWPSKQTSRLTYVNDESNADWSSPHFVDMIASVETAYPNTTISFVSHSMGGRFAAAGMAYLRHSQCPKCVGRTLFFAPDVDSDRLFDEFVASGLCVSNPVPKTPAMPSALVTLYVSNRDTALRDSQQLHGHQRAGQAGSELILCNGVDTIDVSYVKGDDRYGHLYQVYREVLKDSAYAIGGVGPTNPLRGDKVVQRPNGAYYELKQLAPPPAPAASATAPPPAAAPSAAK